MSRFVRNPTRIVRESDYSPASQLFCRVKKTMTGKYHKLDLVNIDAHTKFGLIMSIFFFCFFFCFFFSDIRLY